MASPLDAAGLALGTITLFDRVLCLIIEHTRCSKHNKVAFSELLQTFEKMRENLETASKRLEAAKARMTSDALVPFSNELKDIEESLEDCGMLLTKMYIVNAAQPKSPISVILQKIFATLTNINMKLAHPRKQISSDNADGLRLSADARESILSHFQESVREIKKLPLLVLGKYFSLSSSQRKTPTDYLPSTLGYVKSSLECIEYHLHGVVNLLSVEKACAPASSAEQVEETLVAVQTVQYTVREAIQLSSILRAELDPNNFVASGSTFQKVRTGFAYSAQKGMTFFKSRITNSKLAKLKVDAEQAETKLRDTLNTLTILVHQEPLLLEPSCPGTEEFISVYDTPILCGKFVLDYSKTEIGDEKKTPEGELKDIILGQNEHPRNSNTVFPYIGRIYSALGMGGVGKTSGLIGLASESEVRERFSDGIYFISVGSIATSEYLIQKVSEMVRKSGGFSVVKKIQESNSFSDAMYYAKRWFSEKKCLFLCDDLCNSKESDMGFLPELKQFIGESPQSCVVFTTRDDEIARQADFVVPFRPRVATGSISRSIFYSHADLAAETIDKEPIATENGSRRTLSSAIDDILVVCGGLPIALSIAGADVGQKLQHGADASQVLRKYAFSLKVSCSRLIATSVRGYTNLTATIMLSLNQLEDECQNSSPISNQALSMGEIFQALSVLKKQTWAPFSMLQRLWGLSTELETEVICKILASRSLLSLESRFKKNCYSTEFQHDSSEGIVVHDLILEICKNRASQAGMLEFWHNQLLDGYGVSWKWVPVSGSTDGFAQPEESSFSLLPMISPIFSSRTAAEAKVNRSQRWSNALTDDGYIYSNLARHLVGAGKIFNLARLLLDARWATLRIDVGGLSSLGRDFEILIEALRAQSSDGNANEVQCLLIEPLTVIYRAIRCSWSRVAASPSTFAFEMFARLTDPASDMKLVQHYLHNLLRVTPRPWLQPLSQCLADPRTSLEMEIPLGGICRSISYFPSGKHVAVAVQNTVSVVNLEEGKVICRYSRHSEAATSVWVYCVGSKLVVGFRDGTLQVWNVKNNEIVGRPLEGHSGEIHSVTVSGNDKWIVSGSADRTIRIWDAISQATVHVINVHSGPVFCVSVCPRNKMVISGSADSTIIISDLHTGEVVADQLKGHRDSVKCLAVSPKGDRLLSGSADSAIRVWDLTTRKPVRTICNAHCNAVESIRITSDGALAVSVSLDRKLKLWDVEKGTAVNGSGCVHNGLILDVDVSPDSARAVACSFEGSVCVWDLDILNEKPTRRCNTSGLPSSVTSARNGEDVAKLLTWTLSSLGSLHNSYWVSKNYSKSHVETRKIEVQLQGDKFVCVRPGVPNIVLATLSTRFYAGKCNWRFTPEKRLLKAQFGPANAVAYSLLIDDTYEPFPSGGVNRDRRPELASVRNLFEPQHFGNASMHGRYSHFDRISPPGGDSSPRENFVKSKNMISSTSVPTEKVSRDSSRNSSPYSAPSLTCGKTKENSCSPL